MMNAILLSGLWQGAFITATAALITALVPPRHAATRHAVWFSALLALGVVPILSVWHPFSMASPVPPSVTHVTVATSVVTAKAATYSGNWLLIVWLAGVALGLSRLAVSYIRINRIVANATPLREFGRDVMASADVTIPIAAGLFTPLVILPGTLAISLEREDIDSIVQHERTHIARKDIPVNLIQRLIEACLFFNPWVYLICSRLEREREAACDDWVVQSMAEPDRYVECLTQLAQNARHSHVSLLTPSVTGPRHGLVERVARLLDGKVTQLKVNRLVLVASVAAFGLLAVLFQTPNGLASVSDTTSLDTRVDAKTANDVTSPGTRVAVNLSRCNHGAAVSHAVAPNISKEDFKPNLSASALVTVGADGRVESVKIAKSSGSAAIDHATLEAAKNSNYVAATKACKAIAGEYMFHVETGPEPTATEK